MSISSGFIQENHRSIFGLVVSHSLEVRMPPFNHMHLPVVAASVGKLFVLKKSIHVGAKLSVNNLNPICFTNFFVMTSLQARFWASHFLEVLKLGQVSPDHCSIKVIYDNMAPISLMPLHWKREFVPHFKAFSLNVYEYSHWESYIIRMHYEVSHTKQGPQNDAAYMLFKPPQLQ